jgi:extradiol dioxygenase family protein
MFKKVAFTYYPVTDVARARKFYEETLGLKSGSAGNQGDNWWVEPPERFARGRIRHRR